MDSKSNEVNDSETNCEVTSNNEATSIIDETNLVQTTKMDTEKEDNLLKDDEALLEAENASTIMLPQGEDIDMKIDETLMEVSEEDLIEASDEVSMEAPKDSNEVSGNLKDAADDSKGASEDSKAASENSKEAPEHLKEASENLKEALNEAPDSLDALKNALEDSNEALDDSKEVSQDSRTLDFSNVASEEALMEVSIQDETLGEHSELSEGASIEPSKDTSIEVPVDMLTEPSNDTSIELQADTSKECSEDTPILKYLAGETIKEVLKNTVIEESETTKSEATIEESNTTGAKTRTAIQKSKSTMEEGNTTAEVSKSVTEASKTTTEIESLEKHLTESTDEVSVEAANDVPADEPMDVSIETGITSDQASPLLTKTAQSNDSMIENSKESFEVVNTENDEGDSNPGPNTDDPFAEDDKDECIIAEDKISKSSEFSGKDSDVVESIEIFEDPEPEEVPPGVYYIKIQNVESRHVCHVCETNKVVKYSCTFDENKSYICSDGCLMKFEATKDNIQHHEYFTKFYSPVQVDSCFKYVRQCKQCATVLRNTHLICSWEAMDFCKEHCLYRYQKRFKECADCHKSVAFAQLGKYSVRFGCMLRQFCSSACLESKKKRIRICSYCQRIIKQTKVVIGTKYFCRDTCKGMYECLQPSRRVPFILNARDAHCFVCKSGKQIQLEFDYHRTSFYFCSYSCFTIFKFVQNCEQPKKCHTCAKFVLPQYLENHALYYDNALHLFCTETCQHIYIIGHRRVISCCWCKVKKYNFDMIQKNNFLSSTVYVCSLMCLNSLKVSVDAILFKKKQCYQCNKDGAQYELKVSTGAVNNFCSNECINVYQNQFIPSQQPALQGQTRRRGTRTKPVLPDRPGPLPVITNVCSLAPNQQKSKSSDGTIKKIIIIKSHEPPEQKNIATSVEPMKADKECEMKPEKVSVDVQTEDPKKGIDLFPILVPIYIPFPLPVWNAPVPKPVPFPLTIPCPILIPLTKNSSLGVMKEIKNVQVKAPTDPFEAELLMMAELVAAEKKEDAENVDPVDELANTSVAVSKKGKSPKKARKELDEAPVTADAEPEEDTAPPPSPSPPPTAQSQTSESVDKPDANMCLKYTFGVNAWKQWVTTKNSELERSSRRLKLFKTELLQLTSDELNYSLCLFVKEVRKPNGSEYAPDTIYYLCLGIQQYLYENGRIDNIFCDSYYEKFTDCLDEVCQKFSALYNDSHYIVTRVEEEHLWESKQLGAHSPHVLLSTLMFFNTKHFNLTSVDEHMQLSFSHIMKHWKRNPNQQAGTPKQPGSRNVLLRFYPPQSALDGNAKKKKVYEQQENEENPLRCPVKLYEFYLSKCPESVKTRNDVFYLLPERSCVPDSPVWYSTMALDRAALDKMLHRVKMVKEINVALLTN